MWARALCSWRALPAWEGYGQEEDAGDQTEAEADKARRPPAQGCHLVARFPTLEKSLDSGISRCQAGRGKTGCVLGGQQ